MSRYNYITYGNFFERRKDMREPLVLKRRGEDGNKVITVRLKEDILLQLDKLAADTNYSRNELINIILRHGVENVEIK